MLRPTMMLLLLASLPATAHDIIQGAVQRAVWRERGPAVSGQWMRALAAGLPAAGYFTLSNDSEQPMLLVGARSAACGSLTLHQTVREHVMSARSGLDPQGGSMPGQGGSMPGHGGSLPGHGSSMPGHDGSMPGHGSSMPGMSMMQPVAGVPVAAHGSVRFTPGGYHLMCEQPTSAVQPGQSITVTLLFDSGRSLDAAFPVRGARGR